MLEAFQVSQASVDKGLQLNLLVHIGTSRLNRDKAQSRHHDSMLTSKYQLLVATTMNFLQAVVYPNLRSYPPEGSAANQAGVVLVPARVQGEWSHESRCDKIRASNESH